MPAARGGKVIRRDAVRNAGQVLERQIQGGRTAGRISQDIVPGSTVGRIGRVEKLRCRPAGVGPPAPIDGRARQILAHQHRIAGPIGNITNRRSAVDPECRPCG